MKNMYRLLLLLCLCGLCLASCDDLLVTDQTGGEWAIFRLADPSVTSDQVRDVPLSDMKLADVPFISARELESYHWKTHMFECTPEADSLLDSLGRYGGSTRGVPFVVTVDRQPIYLGSFWWGYSSMVPWCPFVEIAWPQSRRIQLPSLYQGKDPRSDPRIYSALKNAGVLTDE